MSSDLSDIRAAFEHHIESYGPLLPDSTQPKIQSTGSARVPKAVVPAIESSLIISLPEPEVIEKPAIVSEAVRSAYERITDLIPAGSPLLSMNTLEDVEAFVRSTTLISLDETRKNPVFGVGHPDADLMVIGEAPGADEDAQGEPFVGRAGKLLTKILQAIGFEREDVYIANILKSRPPGNRDPLPDEIKAHVPILYRQISLIQPRILLCVGKTSGTSLLGVKTSLAALRGTFHDFHGLPVMVTYHPAALLRNPNWKRPTWEDMQTLRDKYVQLGGRYGVIGKNEASQ